MKVRVSKQAKVYHDEAMNAIDKLAKETGKNWAVIYEPKYYRDICLASMAGAIISLFLDDAYSAYKRHKENKETEEEC